MSSRWDDLFNTPTPDPNPHLTAVPTPTTIGGTVTSYAAAALRSEAETVATAPEGTRNDTLNRAAFRMGRHIGAGGIDAATVHQALTDAARRAGLPQHEIDLVLRDRPDAALHQGTRAPRHPDPTYTPATAPPVTILDPREEAGFWDARPILTHLRDFARARRVSPWGVLGVALANIVAATPVELALPPIIGGKASLNLFVGLVGTSGSGKGACESVADDALKVGYLRHARIASGEAIAHVYKTRATNGKDPVWRDETHAAVIHVAEIDRLAGQAGRQGSTIMADLRSAWSGEMLGQIAADATRSIPLEAHQYRLCLIAGIQPARAGCLLDDADGGTPQRFLWFDVVDRDAPDQPPAEPAPMPWSPPRVGDLVGYGGALMDVCATARDTIVAARLARLRGDGDALDGHALLAQLKTAAALALADQRLNVNDDDWQLATIIATKSAETRQHVVDTLARRNAAENQKKAEAEAARAVTVEERVTEAAGRRVAKAVRRRLERADDWVGRSDLKRAVTSADRGHVEAAIEHMVASGEIEVDEVQYRGQTGARYRLAGGNR